MAPDTEGTRVCPHLQRIPVDRIHDPHPFRVRMRVSDELLAAPNPEQRLGHIYVTARADGDYTLYSRQTHLVVYRLLGYTTVPAIVLPTEDSPAFSPCAPCREGGTCRPKYPWVGFPIAYLEEVSHGH